MKVVFAVLLLSALGSVKAEEAASPLSFNVSAVNEYRYRGLSQSRLQPALQGGLDYAAPNGFYAGAWASTIRWIKDAGGRADVELDLYGGYKAEVAPGLTLDVGALQYVYPSNDMGKVSGFVNADTLELYVALSYGPVTAKYSHSLSHLFGTPDSKGSGYLDISATLDLGQGYSLVPHVGHQRVARNSIYSYTDWSLTVSKDAAGFTWGLGAVGTNTDAYVGAGKNLGKAGVLLSVKKVF